MEQRKLGDRMVSAIGLGCMSFGHMFGKTTLDDSLACLDAAYHAGIDFLDTANIYGMGVSEEAVGQWLTSRKANVVLATKASIVPGPPRSIRNDDVHLRDELTKSLKRLGRDHVELFYIHRRQQEIPVEEVAGTLGRMIDEGLIGGYGLSEVAPSTLRRAHAERPCTAVQNEYSLWSRQPELGVIQTCKELGVTFVPFSPLARGMLTDAQPDRDRMTENDFRRANPRFIEPNLSANLAAIEGFRRFAQARGWTTSAAALAWVLQRGDHLIPIPGTRTAAHLANWADAGQIRFSDEDWAEIDRLLPVGFAYGDRYSDGQIVGVERYC